MDEQSSTSSDGGAGPGSASPTPGDPLSAVTETVLDAGGWVLDLDAETVRLSDGARELHGVTTDGEMPLQEVLGQYHPEDRERVEASLRSGTAFDETVRVSTPEGDRWLRLRGAPAGEEESTERVRGAVQDVTDRQAAAKAKQVDTAKVRALSEAFPDLAVLFSSEGRCLEVYSTGDATVLPSHESMRGQTVSQMFESEAAERIEREIATTLETDAIGTVEYRVPVDGGTRWFEGRTAPVEHRVDGQEAVVMVARDVTERKATEEHLEWRETHLRNAQIVAELGSWVRDVPENEIWWSDGAYEIFGRDPARGTLDHAEFMSYVHPEDRQELERAWEAALAGEPYDIEHRILVDGETRWVREKATFDFDAEDRPQRGVGVVQDITDRKAYERELEERNEQLAVLNRVLRHDLRNHMSVIIGRVEGLTEAHGEELRPYTKPIQESAEALLTISREVDELRELIAGDYEGSADSLDSIAAAAVRSVRETYPDASYTVSVPEDVRIRGAEPVYVALRQLVENAVVHNVGPEPTVEVSAEASAETITVEVTDDGPGIDHHEYEYAVGQRERTQLDHASGLGLWIVSCIVAHCDGDLAFDTDGDGTTVSLQFPRAADPA